ncbi:RNA-dependent DNA polymerase, partial [Trifolium medium]|nr:RNA-dependent DNA polymerase [Trifolium medium]
MGYVFKLFDSPVSWSSKKQTVVALSICEAEYISACYAACQ